MLWQPMIMWPLTLADVRDARERIHDFLSPTALRNYGTLDAVAGKGIRVLVKHENHNPTNCFKARNGMAALSALPAEQRSAGVIAASRGNHGQALAWAGAELGVPVTACVPVGNNPEKNEAMGAFGAKVIERGADHDEAIAVANEIAQERGAHVVHSTNDIQVLAGLLKLRRRLAGKSVVIILSGGNTDRETLMRVLKGGA